MKNGIIIVAAALSLAPTARAGNTISISTRNVSAPYAPMCRVGGVTPRPLTCWEIEALQKNEITRLQIQAAWNQAAKDTQAAKDAARAAEPAEVKATRAEAAAKATADLRARSARQLAELEAKEGAK